VSAATVRHDDDQGRFVIEIGGAEAYMRYRRGSDDRVDFLSTFVPPALRGRGLAEQIVRAGFAWAKAEGLTVIPRCSYVQRLARQDPALETLTAD
jgi:predicted GNAT family acetyltransferase